QAEALWAIRHGISDAQRHAGISIKHDVAVPLSVLDPFISETSAALHAHLPGVRIVCFGHVGDGNLHFNLSQPEGISADAYRAEAEALSDIVHAAVWRFGGTVSAEHGIGLAKRGLLERQVSPAALTLMRQLKLAWDPECLMNPGKILRDNH
ncbi:MAG: FAD-linked oxidase C-terminal domain-containing protein, partial [Pseudomonadota bacterium]